MQEIVETASPYPSLEFSEPTEGLPTCTRENSESADDDANAESDANDDEEPRLVVLKFLLGTEAAGSIIGKHGATVAELEAASGIQVQLSKVQEHFPGTTSRTVALCGTLTQVRCFPPLS